MKLQRLWEKLKLDYSITTACYALCFTLHYTNIFSIKINLYEYLFIFFGTFNGYLFLKEKKISKLFFSLQLITSFFIPSLSKYVAMAFLIISYGQFLRQIFWLKPLIISICWCLLIFPDSLKGINWLTLLEAFCFILSLSLLFDVRDTKEDEERGLKTFTKVVGHIPSKLISGLFFLSYIVLKSHALGLNYKILMMALGYTLINLLTNHRRPKIYSYLVVDSLIGLQFLLFRTAS